MPDNPALVGDEDACEDCNVIFDDDGLCDCDDNCPDEDDSDRLPETEAEIEEKLAEVLNDALPVGMSVRTFTAVGALTLNKGLMLRVGKNEYSLEMVYRGRR